MWPPPRKVYAQISATTTAGTGRSGKHSRKALQFAVRWQTSWMQLQTFPVRHAPVEFCRNKSIAQRKQCVCANNNVKVMFCHCSWPSPGTGHIQLGLHGNESIKSLKRPFRIRFNFQLPTDFLHVSCIAVHDFPGHMFPLRTINEILCWTFSAEQVDRKFGHKNCFELIRLGTWLREVWFSSKAICWTCSRVDVLVFA